MVSVEPGGLLVNKGVLTEGGRIRLSRRLPDEDSGSALLLHQTADRPVRLFSGFFDVAHAVPGCLGA